MVKSCDAWHRPCDARMRAAGIPLISTIPQKRPMDRTNVHRGNVPGCLLPAEETSSTDPPRAAPFSRTAASAAPRGLPGSFGRESALCARLGASCGAASLPSQGTGVCRASSCRLLEGQTNELCMCENARTGSGKQYPTRHCSAWCFPLVVKVPLEAVCEGCCHAKRTTVHRPSAHSAHP